MTDQHNSTFIIFSVSLLSRTTFLPRASPVRVSYFPFYFDCTQFMAHRIENHNKAFCVRSREKANDSLESDWQLFFASQLYWSDSN